MNVTALLIILAIIAVSFIFMGWNRAHASSNSNTQGSENIERPIPAQPAMARPEVVIHYDIDIRDEPPLAREKTMTLRNSGGPAFKVQIQDIAYKNFVAKFPPVSEVTQGRNKSVQAEIYHNNQIAGLLWHDFVRILEEKLQDTDGKIPVSLEAPFYTKMQRERSFAPYTTLNMFPGQRRS